MSTPQTLESPNFLILILICFFLKFLFDFKLLGGFNYPLLIKLLHKIMIILALMIIMHHEEMKKSPKTYKNRKLFQKKFK